MDDVILLDGGMGQELYRRGIQGDKNLWSAHALIGDADIVCDIHQDFIMAGAQVITTNTYSTKPGRLHRAGVGEYTKPLNRIACEVAARARDKAGKPDIKIAASIPPQYSYRPDIKQDFDEMRADYDEMVGLLAPYVDLFLCETMTDATEARAAAMACAASGKPVWCAWSLADDGSGVLRTGDSITETLRAMHGVKLDAFLVNCCAPESVGAAMPHMAAFAGQRAQNASKVRIGGYANGFTPIPPQWAPGEIAQLGVRRNLTPDNYARYVLDWVQNGARIVGGCCEIGPAHIKAINAALGRA